MQDKCNLQPALTHSFLSFASQHPGFEGPIVSGILQEYITTSIYICMIIQYIYTHTHVDASEKMILGIQEDFTSTIYGHPHSLISPGQVEIGP